MASIQNLVHYCCISRGSRALYVYSSGEREIENLAALALECTPAYHKWYFETVGKRTVGFLIEDSYLYFTIVDEGLQNMGILKFLEHVRDEFKKVARKGSRGSFSGINSINNMHEQLVPAIHRLITSLEHVSESGINWNAENPSFDDAGLSPSPSNLNGKVEVVNSTKAPLLGKSNKQDKRKSKDHVIAMRDVELEEHRKSTDRGVKIDAATMDSSNQSGAASSITLQKDMGSMRIRSNTQCNRKKWWRQVRIVLAIDAAICLILFIIWLSICGGFGCISGS
ncbi:hypothetical protein K2173_007108 [Erythroxylum novogranatense]|uniref:Longin domain-containing protein n=1 Tax=Erythroxylum novogranatense TaxID=1862640 RepID=A0AAV8SZR4_9ROSI|nr:hypothetical protein K2173_007108 [Erythroxylum novogranatense]